jgi:hypothetical protein
MNLFFLSI